MIKVSRNSLKLRFIDIRNYVAGGSLEQFVKNFGTIKAKKGFFPYQYITWNNWETELFKSEPFELKDFYSDLSLSTISYDDYQLYLKVYKGFSNRL